MDISGDRNFRCLTSVALIQKVANSSEKEKDNENENEPGSITK